MFNMPDAIAFGTMALSRGGIAITAEEVREEKVRRLKIISDIEETLDGSIGVLLIDGEIVCFILTPDSIDIKYHLVPKEEYLVKRFHGTKFKDTFEIIVEGHTEILFHWGTTEEDTKGCVILGMKVGTYKGKRALFESKIAFGKFMAMMGDEQEAILEVI